MMRRVEDRLRTSWTSLLRDELGGVRAEFTTSWTSSINALRRDIVAGRDVVDARVAAHDLELVNALHRVAGAFENIAESLDSDRRDRRAHLDTVELLLREMVLGWAQPTALRPAVLGGTVGTGARPLSGVDIHLSDSPIPVDVHVEVRSRFDDHWVHGFAIAEYVCGADRRGYRLRRLADTERLPLLFDAADVRPVTVASNHPALDTTKEAKHSLWR